MPSPTQLAAGVLTALALAAPAAVAAEAAAADQPSPRAETAAAKKRRSRTPRRRPKRPQRPDTGYYDETSLHGLEYEVELIGSQSAEWYFLSEEYPKADRMWDRGHGRQTVEWRSARPLLMFAIKGPPGPLDLPRMRTLGLRRAPLLQATVDRRSSWRRNTPPPACEGCGGEPWRVSDVPQTCGERRTDMELESFQFRHGPEELDVKIRWRTWPKPYTSCAPDSGNGTSEISFLGRQPEVTFRRLERVIDLKLNERVLFHAYRDDKDDCKLPNPARVGRFDWCLTSAMTLKVRRVA